MTLRARHLELLFPFGMVTVDLLTILLSLQLSLHIEMGFDPLFVRAADPCGSACPFPHVYLFIPVWFFIFWWLGFYAPDPFPHGRPFLLHVKGVTLSVLTLIAGAYVFGLEISRSTVLVYWLISVCAFTIVNAPAIELLRHVEKGGYSGGGTAIIGTDCVIRAIGDTVLEESSAEGRLCGYIAGSTDQQNDSERTFGTLDNLESLIGINGIRRLLVYRSAISHQELTFISSVCERHDIDFYLIPDLLDSLPVSSSFSRIGRIPMLRMRRIRPDCREQRLKRLFDITAVLIGGVLLAPVMAVTALLIRLDSPGPVIYRQKRTGMNGEEFDFYKFRSMVADADRLRELVGARNQVDQRLYKVKEDPRITRVGRIIRKLSIDELPQLWNVLKGDMTLVGPRPLPVSDMEIAKLDPENKYWYNQRIHVRPGITGMWQIRGRSELSFQEMVRYDVYYILNWSLPLDLEILLQTIPAVLFGRGAY